MQKKRWIAKGWDGDYELKTNSGKPLDDIDISSIEPPHRPGTSGRVYFKSGGRLYCSGINCHFEKVEKKKTHTRLNDLLDASAWISVLASRIEADKKDAKMVNPKELRELAARLDARAAKEGRA